MEELSAKCQAVPAMHTSTRLGEPRHNPACNEKQSKAYEFPKTHEAFLSLSHPGLCGDVRLCCGHGAVSPLRCAVCGASCPIAEYLHVRPQSQTSRVTTQAHCAILAAGRQERKTVRCQQGCSETLVPATNLTLISGPGFCAGKAGESAPLVLCAENGR